ncbi:glycosyltransferase [Aquimarina pacifica]|uniref:glycosyltransferase n=1 Tax=Aquimarina pacifica TaxID=1296415 RepID=UPI00046F22DC|nr:glycosyltransferase [Aquimarina pacifica]
MESNRVNKKKVLFVIDSLSSGGAEKSLVTVLSLLDKTKYDIHLLTFKKGGLYEPLVPEEVIRLEAPDYFKYLSRNPEISFSKQISFSFNKYLAAFGLRFNRVIGNLVSKYKLHPAQTNWFFTKSGFEPLEQEFDAAVAYSQGLPTYYVATKVKSKTKFCWININYSHAGYSSKFDYPFYSKYTNIVTVSDKANEVFGMAHPDFKEKTGVVYDILSGEVIKKMGEDTTVGFTDGYTGTRILTIGRLATQKGYDMAIKACSILKKKGIDFRWYAIGEGPLKIELEKLVKEFDVESNFIFLGTFSNPYPFVKQCDIYCQPSKFEGFGLAIAEARILAKPIVVTNFEIVYNQIKHTHNGFITEMNANAIADGLEEVIGNEDIQNKFVANLEKEVISNESEISKVSALLDA